MPVLLLVLHVTVPVALNPDTVAVQLTREPAITRVGPILICVTVGIVPVQGCISG